MKFLILFILFLVSRLCTFSQELSYTHYDRNDGLAGSIAYSMVQDKDGFLWIGTETGLSRFDGTRFVNFTMREGLPDNEVLSLFADSKGRVWIMPFKISICYYFHGKIYTQENDSILSKIHLTNNVFNIAEDINGNIILQENGRLLHEITAGGEVIDYKTEKTTENFISIIGSPTGGYWVLSNVGLYLVKEGSLSQYMDLPFFYPHTLNNSLSGKELLLRDKYPRVTRFSLLSKRPIESLVYDRNTNRISFLNDSMFFAAQKDGIIVGQITGKNSIKKRFMSGYSVLSFFVDNEKNWWFLTENKGVFRLNSKIIKNRYFYEAGKQKIGIKSLLLQEDKLVIGSDQNNVFIGDYGHNELRNVRDIPERLHSTTRSSILFLGETSQKQILFGTGVGFFRLDEKKGMQSSFLYISAKAMEKESDSVLIIGTNNNVQRFNSSTFLPIDTVWDSRPTCLNFYNDTLYIGTLNGLYRLTKKYNKTEYLGEKIAALKGRVSGIRRSNDGIIWVAMYGAGLVALQNDSVLRTITEEDGLASNVCLSLFIHKKSVWVGTNYGLSKISVKTKTFDVSNYTVADGLASDVINAVCANDTVVFVASPEGLTYFNESLIREESSSNLKITKIEVQNKLFAYDSTNFVLKHSENNIRIEFVGISFKSGGNMVYRYRVLGLDDQWQTTNSNYLSYPSLPSGSYTLQIQAVNKFGTNSEIKNIVFEIEKMTSEKTWFKLLLFLGVISAFIFAGWLLLRGIRKKEIEKASVTQKLSELEQLALKSQMNPHFIFNSLNSIQQYVIDKDIAGANRFISDFSKLIRLTLDYASKTAIPVMDEINYLKTYMELEKRRLEGKFAFNIEVATEVMEGDFLVPPMLIQPYIENSIRHGIRFRNDNDGLIKLSVFKKDEYLQFIVEDNGIGRKAASLYKAANPIEYQSKGMSLTANRIDFMNRHRKSKLTVLIEDLIDKEFVARGTRVTVSFPENLI